MRNKRHMMRNGLVAACAALAVVAGSGAAYAADLGGIQRTVQLWVHGDQTTATLTISDDGSYALSGETKDGKAIRQGGGGVAFAADGKQRQLTEAEILEQLDAPEVTYEDGKAMLYWRGEQLDITDKFDKDGYAYVQLIRDGKPLYITVQHGGGYAYSKNNFVQPGEFNTLPEK